MSPDQLPILLSSLAFGLAVGLGVLPLFEGLNVRSRRLFAEVEEQMLDLGMDTRVLPALAAARWMVTAAVGVGVAVGMGMVPVGLFLGVLTYNLFGAWLRWRVDRYRTRIRDQLVSAARNFSNQVRAGLAILRGLEATARELPAPLSPLLRRVVQQAERGRPLKEALTELKDAVRIDAMTLFVIAVRLALDKGGDLSVVLDRMGYSLEELQRVERKKDSETAAGKLVVWLLSAFPFAFLAFFFLLDPESTGLLFSLLGGQVVLSVVGLLVYLSFLWAQSILKKVE